VLLVGDEASPITNPNFNLNPNFLMNFKKRPWLGWEQCLCLANFLTVTTQKHSPVQIEQRVSVLMEKIHKSRHTLIS
jgi:hypothetical protein